MSIVSKIKHNEGYRARPYMDTVGKLTVGFGHNLDDVDFPIEISTLLLESDIKIAMEHLYKKWPHYRTFNTARQNVLIDMSFNLGISRLAGFKKMHRALAANNFVLAASELLDSKYARQVGRRADDNARELIEG